MNFRSYFRKSLFLLVGGVGVICALFLPASDPASLIAGLWGIGLSFANAILGYAILAWGYRRSQQQFMGAVFGGMIFRFLLIFAFLFVLIGALNVKLVTFLVTFLVTYFLYLGLEIFQVHQQAEITRIKNDPGATD